MKLRKQLLLISLITLTLPWAGYQYIQEMERTLKQGQAMAMAATAKAVSAYLGSAQDTRTTLQAYEAPAQTQPIYLHPLARAPIVDGYGDEWMVDTLAQQQIANADSPVKMQIIAGVFQKQMYLYMRVFDRSIRYFNPTLPSPATSDHLKLIVDGRELLVFASGPGAIQAAEQVQGPRLQPVYRIKGQWLEAQEGYQVEISLPREWAETSLGIKLYDAASDTITANYLNEPPPVIQRSKLLEAALAIFNQPGLQMSIGTASGRLVAADGDLKVHSGKRDQHGFIPWFYQFVIGTRPLPDLDTPATSGQLETPEIAIALQPGAKPALGWYQQNNKTIVRVASPIEFKGLLLGVVVLDQSADSLVTMTSSAFYRLLFYSLVTTSAAGGIFMIYATWLSLRIRKLSRATAAAVSDTGKIAEDFPILRNRDELGDLSRHYAQLLVRLREYTNYLRTLSSKLSHELRTPLAIVRSSLDNLEHTGLSEQAKVYSERAKEGTSRLSNILNSMSAASRVEQAISGAELELIPCDELLSNLKAAYQDVYQQIQFSLKIEKDSGPLTCMASGELLVQMLDKLVDNAADFCPAGGQVELGLYRQQQHIVFTVRNEGPPLPQHMQGQLFDSMVSVRASDKAEDAGHHLGLGLYIVRLIVDFHRGQVTGYNLPDASGVIFEVRLPT